MPQPQYARITATFTDCIIAILISAASSATYFFNHMSLKAFSDAARIDSINALAALYRRTKAATLFLETDFSTTKTGEITVDFERYTSSRIVSYILIL
jgi:hypothetical protein